MHQRDEDATLSMSSRCRRGRGRGEGTEEAGSGGLHEKDLKKLNSAQLCCSSRSQSPKEKPKQNEREREGNQDKPRAATSHGPVSSSSGALLISLVRLLDSWCSGTGTVMDGRSQQNFDLIMRHRGMGMELSRCESEEALGSSESEPGGRPARPRGKRTRAAEVHNLSEKRRRCRINEKMKALQSLIPNSSKTDKASMLDDAIEYLKQLQLQVQMLSMRNGLYLPPVNLPGAPEPLLASQICAALNQNSVEASNPPVGVLPVNQISGAQHSFDPPNHDAQHHAPLVLPSLPSRITSERQFLLETSQPDLRSFLSTVSAEMILQEDVMLKHHLSSTQKTTSIPGHDMKPVGQETPVVRADHFDRCSIWKKQSQDVMPKNTDSVLFMPHLHRFQSGDTEEGVVAGSK